MLCKVCGAAIPDDAAECEFCGAKISDNNAPEGESLDETKIITQDEIKAAAAAGEASEAKDALFDENEKKRQEQMKKMLEDKQKQLSAIEKRRAEKRQKQKRNKILLIALICALAVGAAGIGAYYVAQNVNTPKTVDESPVPTIEATATPLPTPTPAVTATPAATPALNMTPAPNDASSAGSTASAQSWTATGSGNSGSGQRTASSSASGGGSSSGGSKSSSSGNGSGGNSTSGGASSSGGGSGSASASGSSTANIGSKLVTGGEVIYNGDTGRYLMTFVSDGVKYYANVSEGSTTEQIQNKPFTVTAAPTGESYNGNTVYEISSITGYSGDYLLENSGTRLLTENDIKGMSKYDLALARNEIYARHGRKFQTEEYNKYFSAKSWYHINPNYNYSDDDSNLNDIEEKNVQFILNAEKR